MKAIATKFDDSSTLSADEFNPNMTELENAVINAGLTLDETDLTQLGEAMGRYGSGGAFFYNEGGASNAFVLTSPSLFTQPKSYFNGMIVMCTAGFSVTSACTINVNSIGSVALVEATGLAISTNYITAGDTFIAMYNSTSLHFRIIMISRVVPQGSIALFSGAVSNIAAGWQLCDGTNGTPNLQDQFVRGAGNTYAVDETGGAEITGSTTLATTQIPSHTHTYNEVNSVTGSTVLTIAQLPAHSHNAQCGTGTTPPLTFTGSGTNTFGGGTADDTWRTFDTGDAGSGSGHTHTASSTSTVSGSTGGGLGHTHSSPVPPFYALAYIMKL